MKNASVFGKMADVSVMGGSLKLDVLIAFWVVFFNLYLQKRKGFLKNAGEEWDDIQSISAGGQITLSAVPVPALLLSGLRPATLQDQLENDWKGQDSWQPFSIKFSSPYSSGRFCRVQHTKVMFCKAFLRAARPAPLWAPWQRLPPTLHEAAHTLFLNAGFFAEARAAPCGPSGSSPASEAAAAFAAANRGVPGPPRCLRSPPALGAPLRAPAPHTTHGRKAAAPARRRDAVASRSRREEPAAATGPRPHIAQPTGSAADPAANGSSRWAAVAR